MGNKIWLIGDTIIDRNTYGEAIGLSAETPTITIRESRTVETFGGAAFVSANLNALGCGHTFISNDSVGVPTVTKHRFWADGYKLFQVNTVADFYHSGYRIIDLVNPQGGDVVVFSDYRHGFLTEYAVSAIIKKAKNKKAYVFVDTQVSKQESNHEWYKDADFMFVNSDESRFVPQNYNGVLIIKSGENGAYLKGNGYNKHIPGIYANVVDTCGAGDAFLAAFIEKYYHKIFSLPECVGFANRWAARKCELEGMQVPSLEDMED